MKHPSSPEDTKAVLEKVNQIGLMAGFNLQPHPSSRNILVAGFDLGNGRSQSVYIRYTGQTMDGHDAASFMSPCLEVKSTKLLGGGGLSKRLAVDILRRNATLPFGSFGLFRFENRSEILMVISNHLIDTMAVEEFRTYISYVALAADEYERELGRDSF